MNKKPYKKTKYTDRAIELFCEREHYAKPFMMATENILLKNHGKAIRKIEKEVKSEK